MKNKQEPSSIHTYPTPIDFFQPVCENRINTKNPDTAHVLREQREMGRR
jgi:hypothetical protein